MNNVLSTVLMIVAAAVCVVVVFNAVYPAITSSSGAMSSASARMSERIRSQIQIIHASGELDSVGSFSDTDSDGDFDVFIWVKNVGSEVVTGIDSCDVFIAGNQTVWAWIPHTDYASGAYPQWDYSLENGTDWTRATTLKIEINYDNSPLPSGEYKTKVLIPNGVTDDYHFSM
jgi:archaellum component FlaG (FlaF/FlaG flagellin family)